MKTDKETTDFIQELVKDMVLNFGVYHAQLQQRCQAKGYGKLETVSICMTVTDLTLESLKEMHDTVKQQIKDLVASSGIEN